MRVSFDDLKIEQEGRSNRDPFEVVLLKGVEFDRTSSTVPCAYSPDHPTGAPGITFTGYVYAKGEDYLDISFDKILSFRDNSKLGGVRVYRRAIYSLDSLATAW